MDRLNDMVYRILVSMFAAGLFDHPHIGHNSSNVQSKEHAMLSRRLAEQGTVLLKNDGNLLPLSVNSAGTIAVIGADASTSPIISGFGSGYVVPPYIVTPLQGIMNRVPHNVEVTYANGSNLVEAQINAKSADVAIVFVATDSSEGTDRTTLELGGNQDQLIQGISSVQPNTIVVIHTPGAVLMPWVSDIPAIVCAFLPGQEDGNAIAAVLFGDVNPSARLPVTFPMSNKQIPVNTVQQYPGIDNEAQYSEELLVGYRWYDAMEQDPLFPFGYGLSYTTFNYSNLNVFGSIETDGILVSVDIANIGGVGGAEIVQLYINFPESAGEPPQVLKGFYKTQYLMPTETQTVVFKLLAQDVSIWSIEIHDWEVVSGTFGLSVGASSRDPRLQAQFVV